MRKFITNGVPEGFVSIADSNSKLEVGRKEGKPHFKVLGHEQEGLIGGIF